jgi:putative phosphoesterase
LRLGIMSDSHDNLPMIAQAVDLFNSEKVDLVLHAGDFVSPFTAMPFRGLNARLMGIFGNNDGDKPALIRRFTDIGEIYEDYRELELAGRKIALMHQPKFLESLMASSLHDLIIYGHTHSVDLRDGPPLVVNPGECGAWLTGIATVATVDLKTMTACVHTLALPG